VRNRRHDLPRASNKSEKSLSGAKSVDTDVSRPAVRHTRHRGDTFVEPSTLFRDGAGAGYPGPWHPMITSSIRVPAATLGRCLVHEGRGHGRFLAGLFRRVSRKAHRFSLPRVASDPSPGRPMPGWAGTPRAPASRHYPSASPAPLSRDRG